MVTTKKMAQFSNGRDRAHTRSHDFTLHNPVIHSHRISFVEIIYPVRRPCAILLLNSFLLGLPASNYINVKILSTPNFLPYFISKWTSFASVALNVELSESTGFVKFSTMSYSPMSCDFWNGIFELARTTSVVLTC